MTAWLEKTQRTMRALLLDYKSPHQLAFAVALGIFVGASPLWGLHTILAVGGAFLFKLNKSAVLLASFISNPLFLPFLFYPSLNLGSLLIRGQGAPLAFREIKSILKHPDWHDLLESYLVPYFWGAFLVAILLAVCFYFLTLYISRRAGAQETGRKPEAG